MMSPSPRLRHTILLLAACLLSAVGCDTGGKSAAYDEGCRDGYDFGYTNGLLHGEGCVSYDDDPGERYADTGDPDALEYNEGYLDCYPEGYSDGFTDGSAGVTCRRRRPAAKTAARQPR